MIGEIFAVTVVFFAIIFISYGFYFKFLREKIFENIIHYKKDGSIDYIEEKRKEKFNFLKKKIKKEDFTIRLKERMFYDINTLGLSIKETTEKLVKEGWKPGKVRKAIKLLKMEIKENGLKTKIEGIIKEENIQKPPRPSTSTTNSGETTTGRSATNRTRRSKTPIRRATTNRFERRDDPRSNRFTVAR